MFPKLAYEVSPHQSERTRMATERLACGASHERGEHEAQQKRIPHFTPARFQRRSVERLSFPSTNFVGLSAKVEGHEPRDS